MSPHDLLSSFFSLFPPCYSEKLEMLSADQALVNRATLPQRAFLLNPGASY